MKISENPWLHTHAFSLLVLTAALLLSFILYFPALNVYFVSEDLQLVTVGWSDVVEELTSFGHSVGFRPGLIFFRVANNLLWGRNPVGHHASVILLHAIMAWLAYLVLQRISSDRFSAALAALIFLAAPTHTEAVIWLSAAAGTVPCGVLFMLGVWLWIRDDTYPHPFTIWLVAAIYFLALLFKEVAAPLPLLLVVLDLALGRVDRKPGAIFRSMLSLWPFAVALCLYLYLYWSAGIFRSSINYGFRWITGPAQLVENWSLYARDLFQPLSDLAGLNPFGGNWFWLALFIILPLLVRRARLPAAWTVITLLPGGTTYAPRLTYLAMVGISMMLSLALVEGTRFMIKILDRRVFKEGATKNRMLTWLPGIWIGVLVLSLVSAEISFVRRDIENWVQAGKLTWAIPHQALELLPEPPPGAELYFIDLPDNINGAYVFRWGIIQEIKHVFNDPELVVHHVIVNYPQWEKTMLYDIPCESASPRFFFKYYPEISQLLLVSPQEFGVECP